MFDLLFSHGGMVAYALLLCSIFALAAAIFSAYNLIPQRLAAIKLSRYWLRRACNEIDAEAQQSHALAQVLAAGMRGDDAEQCQALAFDCAQREVAALERGLGIIATIAQIAASWLAGYRSWPH